jgi:hypothetical protein
LRGGTSTQVLASLVTGGGGGGGGGNQAFSYQNGSFNAHKEFAYLVDTSTSTLTVTLPSVPGNAGVGDWVQLYDASTTWGTHNVTVNGNGTNIASSASNMTLNISGSTIVFSYVNSTIGWQAITL